MQRLQHLRWNAALARSRHWEKVHVGAMLGFPRIAKLSLFALSIRFPLGFLGVMTFAGYSPHALCDEQRTLFHA